MQEVKKVGARGSKVQEKKRGEWNKFLPPHSWARTLQILRARGVYYIKFVRLLQWDLEAGGVGFHNPDPLRAQVWSPPAFSCPIPTSS